MVSLLATPFHPVVGKWGQYFFFCNPADKQTNISTIWTKNMTSMAEITNKANRSEKIVHTLSNN